MSSSHDPVTNDANVDLVRRYSSEVWNDRALEKIPEFVHPEYVCYDPGTPEPIRGYDGLKSHIRNTTTAFPDLHDELHLSVGVEDQVLTHYTITGTHNGAYGPLPPTGRPILMDATARLRIEEGKIREEQFYYDTATLQQQLGMKGIGLLRQFPRIAWWNLQKLWNQQIR